MRNRFAVLVGSLLAVLLASVAGVSPRATAQTRIDKLLVCRQLVVQQHPFGSFPEPRDCGSRFTTVEPSLWLFVELYLDQVSGVHVALSDPSQEETWAWRGRMGPQPPARYGSWWILGLLPIAATPEAIVRENPQFPRTVTQERPLSSAVGLVRVGGKPARDRMGDWTLSATVEGGPSASVRFTLVPP